MDTKQKPFGRKGVGVLDVRVTGAEKNSKASMQIVQVQSKRERASILRQDLGSSSLIDVLKGMIRRG